MRTLKTFSGKGGIVTGSRVKGLIVELGGDVKGLDKALSGINKDINKTQSELKDVERLLKLDPTNTELLEQKQRLLADAVSETGGKLETLKEAEKQVQQQFERGDIGQDQYDRLKREIIQTENRLNGFKSAAKQAEKAVEKIDEEPVEDVDRAADQASDALDDAGKSASAFGDVLSAGVIIEGVKGVVGAVKDLHEETAEYRKIMGTLDTSSGDAGYSAKQTEEAYRRLQGVLGDDQAAATTLANLQALKLDQSKLMKLIDLTTGAWAKYGDSIPIDGLAESVNETIKTGKVTGVFADVLTWAGQSEDAFNESLSSCSTEAQRANKVLEAMSSQGLGEMAEAWRLNNEGIVKTNEAQARYMENASKIAEVSDPAIIAGQEGMADLMGKIAEALEKVDMEKLADSIDKFFTIAGDGVEWAIDHSDFVLGALTLLIGLLGTLKGLGMISHFASLANGVNQFAATFPGLSSHVMSFLSNPYVLLVAALIAFVALVGIKGDEMQAHLQKVDAYMQNVFARDWTETFGPVLGQPVNAFWQHLHRIWDNVVQHANGMIDFWRGVFTGNWARAWEGIKEIFSAILGQMVTVAKGPINSIIGMINGMLNAVVGGVNLAIQALNKIPGVSISAISAPSIPYLATGGSVERGMAIVGEAGPELLTVSPYGRTTVQPLASTAERGSNAIGSSRGYSGPETIVVQSVLDGRIIGETAYRYGKGAARAYG